MLEKPTASQTLGLQLDSDSLKGAELSFKQGKPQLVRVFKIMVDQDTTTPENVKLLYTKGQKEELKRLVNHSLVVTGLEAKEVLVRALEINLTKEKDIDAVLEFQAEPLLPYPVEEGVVDRLILSKQTEGSQLTVVAARNDFILNHLEEWKSQEVEPETISCIPAALANFSKQFAPLEATHLIVNIGNDVTTCVLAKRGKLLATQSTNQGIKQLVEALTVDCNLSKEKALEALKKIDFSKINAESTPNFASVYEALKLDTTRLLLALAKQVREEEVADVLITGEGGETKNLGEMLCQSLKKTLITPTESPHFKIPLSKIQKYAVAIGLALGALPKSEDLINFRQKEFSYPYPWKRLKKPLGTYLAACLLLAVTFYMYGNAYVGRQEDRLREDYVGLLELMKVPFSEFESQFLVKTTPGSPLEVEAINLSQRDITQRLNHIEKEIKATPDIFPLLPNTPRVSDVLAWLSTHPHITGENETESPIQPRIQLTNFSYKMVKRPEVNKMREKYQAKVEIDFTTPTPRYAREFHDILLAPNDIVDPKGDVKWSVERGKYRASFFLKDRTYYPTRR